MRHPAHKKRVLNDCIGTSNGSTSDVVEEGSSLSSGGNGNHCFRCFILYLFP